MTVCAPERRNSRCRARNRSLHDPLLYFAYGSNMAVERLRARVAEAERLSPGLLQGHSLRFHKIGRDGSAKCDAFETGNAPDRVHGVLFHIERRSRVWLDRAEGLGMGYDIREVEIQLDSGERLTAFTYCASLIDPRLHPFDWYLEHVLHGARQACLPPDYIEALLRQPCIPDPDTERAALERAIYR
ncbi:gamma-glutamylcyclotransferase family protein [Marinobacterium aestuariivivens]|uniref:Gamma-glutamylcyclotransferase family protein n=1 Tax=Marinobacterium aestuariivivens TaxID=1698799 RepID=A0ABW1ZVZ0_9GAMM